MAAMSQKEDPVRPTPPRFSRDPGGEADLIARYAAGDQSAARTLTLRHVSRLHALAWRMLQNRADAEDVVQEAMLRLWRAAPSWEDRGVPVSTWLYRVAANLCLDRLRRRRERPLEDAPELADPAPGAERRIQTADRAAALQAELACLPDRQRLALVLRHFEEMSNPAIAEVLETSVEAVESLLARARRELAARLAPRREELGLGDG